MKKDLNEGDWVKFQNDGVWQIYRILEYATRNQKKQYKQQNTVVFCKRFLTQSTNRFTEDSCDPIYIKKLSPKYLAKLKRYISKHKSRYEEFVAYEPNPVDLIYNAKIAIPSDKTIKEVESMLNEDSILREQEINPHLKKLGFDTETVPTWTTQYVSKDHQCEDGHLVFNFDRIIEF